MEEEKTNNFESDNGQSNQEDSQATHDASQPEQPIQLDSNLATDQSKSVGPMIGLILIVILIIAGGLYFWLQQQEIDLESIETPPEEEPEEEPVTEDPETDEVVEDLRDVSDSDELEAIERDLEETNLDSLDLTDEELDEILEADLNEL